MIVMGPIVNYARNNKCIRATHLLSTEAGADGRAELVAFGKTVGLRETWLQKRQSAHEHFDVMGARSEKIIAAGVTRIENRSLAALLKRKREQLGLVRVPIAVIRARTVVRESYAQKMHEPRPAE